MNADRVWRVYHRSELVGEVDEREFDFPWIRGRFRSEPAFQPLRPIFAAWIEALSSGDGEAMRQAHEAIYPAVTMTDPDGREVPWFILVIEGDEARFRWRDEPASDR
ncbi:MULTISPECIES: hypothetical protein [Micromonospora]|uniref:hypothetical protein n=1 Tax=Micromonospora TaxID=1873 RepID=UPI00371DAD7E